MGPGTDRQHSGRGQGLVGSGLLPGVTVEARNADGRSQTAVTNDNGVYRFPALPPGVWAVTATLQGFTPAKVENAAIELGKLLSIDLTLSVGGVTESVQVTGESPLIDTKQNASYATIRQDTIERMPKGRDFTSILKTAPGSQAESKAGGEA
ncbi:MAG TPA: carboxypeptidase-like regulatory domain-containing protein, partial [Vicinamibacterales bacterium]|nr:carboxypeptidase-like regulatory domain-containing protein [Vicinamibacterales bacterium]